MNDLEMTVKEMKIIHNNSPFRDNLCLHFNAGLINEFGNVPFSFCFFFFCEKDSVQF